MKSIIKIVLASVVVALLAFVSGSGNAIAQQYGQTLKQQLVGTWTLVSNTNDRGGTKTQPFGSNPSGMAIFDSAGHIVYILMRSDLPKFASNNRLAGTPEENKAVIQGSLVYFGTYTVQDDHTYALHVQGSTYPNWTGTDLKRSASITGDELSITDPTPSSGGTSLTIWRRAK